MIQFPLHALSLRANADIGADLASVLLMQVNMRKNARYGYRDTGDFYDRCREYYID